MEGGPQKCVRPGRGHEHGGADQRLDGVVVILRTAVGGEDRRDVGIIFLSMVFETVSQNSRNAAYGSR